MMNFQKVNFLKLQKIIDLLIGNHKHVSTRSLSFCQKNDEMTRIWRLLSKRDFTRAENGAAAWRTMERRLWSIH